MQQTCSARYKQLIPLMLSAMILHGCSGDSTTVADSVPAAFPTALAPADGEPETIHIVVSADESTDTTSQQTGNESAVIDTNQMLSDQAGDNSTVVVPVNDEQVNSSETDATVEAETNTDTMVVHSAQPNDTMSFLVPLGQAPYGNLPQVSYDLGAQDIRYNADDFAPDIFDGCLLARFGIIYCYQPENRILKSVLADGSPFWSFTLPGDNSFNRVDGVAMTDWSELALVANITTEFGTPKHEASFFDNEGAFDRTIDILKLNGTVWPTINLQGEPLEVVQSSTISNGPFPLQVIGNTYELIPGGNRANPIDWEQNGIMRANMDSDTGEYLNVELCEDARVGVAEGGIGMELCEDIPDDSPLYVRNNGQKDLRSSLDRLTDSSTRLTADMPSVYRDAFTSFGLVPDLRCDPLDDLDCLAVELPNVGDRLTSSLSSIQCSELSWSSEQGEYVLGNAQWRRLLVRTSRTQVEIQDIMMFTDRCALADISGQLTGNVILVTTVDSDSGEVLDTETRFEDLSSVVLGDYRRFVDGIYRNTSNETTYRYELSAQQVYVGLVCNRSCPPYIITGGYYSDLDIVSSRDNVDAGSFAYRYNAQWLQTLGSPTTPFYGVPETLSADITYSAPISITAKGNLEGFIELVQKNGAQVRMEPTANFNYPNLSFVQYNATAPTGEVFEWVLPIDAFLSGTIASYSAR